METIDARFRPRDWPYERKDDPPGSPLLFVHLTKFSDGAVLAISVPHFFANQGGLANNIKAWLTVIEGKIVPEMTGYKDDVLRGEKLSNVEVNQDERVGRVRIRSKKDQALVIGRIALDLWKENKEESRLVFLPIQVVQNLRDKARERLDGKHPLAREISNGDIITTIFTMLARIDNESKHDISLSSTINCKST
ncbi:hypothetical protein FDENT_2375 [Fusarium denticulatum]|uniref:Uncharacterized protein n=1 Tax=Fusarium denticulatum TaxID=48507 RepID=A0A8H6CUQ9_9HYPO|nr:hypothetical protein FDENT_2375 [Fusarium denticulatum]